MICNRMKHVGVTETRMKHTDKQQGSRHTTLDSSFSGKSQGKHSFSLLCDLIVFTLRGFPCPDTRPQLAPLRLEVESLTRGQGSGVAR